jgi:hypothetical protein
MAREDDGALEIGIDVRVGDEGGDVGGDLADDDTS